MTPGAFRFPIRCSDSGLWNLDSRPGLDVALAAGVAPCADDGAVGPQVEGVSGTRRHGDDARQAPTSHCPWLLSPAARTRRDVVTATV
jgi:hypothetical protein